MIDRIQDHLESIYGVRCEERAHRFLVDPSTASKLGATGRTPEELLVAQSEEGELELALYLDPQLLTRMEGLQELPAHFLLEQALESYCQLAEGVSHFLYVALAADRQRQVSLLELEAQAEVDKFASCLLMEWGDGVGRWAKTLIHRLFESVSYHPKLLPAEKWRYQEANRLSRNYCLRLLPFISSRRLDLLLAELRYGYRLGAEAKLQYLAA